MIISLASHLKPGSVTNFKILSCVSMSTISDCIYSFQLCLRLFNPRYWQNDICTCMHAKLLWSCPGLCNPMDSSPLGCSVHGIIQARILEWAATPSFKGSSRPRDQAHISYFSCIGKRHFSGGSDGKESGWNVGDPGLSISWEDSLKKGMATHSSILAWRTHRQRSLAGHSPWSHKELDTTKWLTLFLYH